ncbi:hypothetical protein OHA21_25225 [Actinoplanes sp. NBC_00393]|uniref:hypothetical protein n=1 Tax=Actinoplanes sp. NBC_00393 TaxID=2975953 RepID=UPI002E24A00A
MARKSHSSSSDILEQARTATDSAAVGRVFGTPVEKDGVLILPVAVISGGGGGGSGSGSGALGINARSRGALGDKTRTKPADDSFGTGATGSEPAGETGSAPEGQTGSEPEGEGSGGGFGFSARPAGVYVLKGGQVYWQPAVDVNKIVLGGQIALVAALLVVRSVLKRRSRRRR